MVELVGLGILYFGGLAAAIAMFPHFQTQLFREGKPIALPKIAAVFLLTGVALVFAAAAWWLFHSASRTLLELLFAFVFGGGWVVNALYFLPPRVGQSRVALSLIIGVVLIGAVYAFPFSLARNLFTIGSLLWLGPMIFRRFSLPLRYFNLGLVLFTLFDIFAIYVVQSDEIIISQAKPLVLNGLIQVGGHLIGIGDFFIGYLIVNAAQHFFSQRLAWALAVWIPLPMVLLPWLWPSGLGQTFPYTMFITPVALAAYAAVHFSTRQKRS